METVSHAEDDNTTIHKLTAEDFRLPEAVFTPDTICEVTVAGRVLRTATNSMLARLDIYDPSSFPELPEGVQPESLFGTAHFQAWLEEFKGARMVKWSVKNRDPQSADPAVKHPGIHPRWLLSRSLTFLDQISADEGLGPIKYLEGRWMKPDPDRPYMSSNWWAYQSAKADLANALPPDQQQTPAAFLTPTGQMAASNGFTNIVRIVEREQEVVVVFERSI